MLSYFVDLLRPEVVFFLMRHYHFDEDRLFFIAVFDNLTVGEPFVTDFGQFFIFWLGGSFRLGVTHYTDLLNQISNLYPKSQPFQLKIIFLLRPISNKALRAPYTDYYRK